MAAVVRNAGGRKVGTPRSVLNIRLSSDSTDSNYDVARDGKRFIALLSGDSAVPMPIVVVENWISELKRLLAAN